MCARVGVRVHVHVRACGCMLARVCPIVRSVRAWMNLSKLPVTARRTVTTRTTTSEYSFAYLCVLPCRVCTSRLVRWLSKMSHEAPRPAFEYPRAYAEYPRAYLRADHATWRALHSMASSRVSAFGHHSGGAATDPNDGK